MNETSFVILWGISGAVISVLLIIVAFFMKRILHEFDTLKMLVSTTLTNHETRITLIEKSGCELADKLLTRSKNERLA